MPYPADQFWLLRLAVVTLVVALGWAGWRRRAGLWEGLGAIDRFGPLLAGGLAFVLRAVLPPGAIFHENGHGYRYIGMAVDPVSDLHVYGSTYQAVYGLLYLVFPPVTDVVLWAQRFAGALTVVFLGWMVGRLFGGGAGALAALALALLPLHIRLSATESLFILAIFFTVLALWAVQELRRAPGEDLLLVTAISAGLAAQIREIFMAAPGLIFLFGMLCQPGAWSFLRRRSTWLFVALTSALMLRHLMWMWELHHESHYGTLLRVSPEVVAEMLGVGLLFNPAFTPLHLHLLGAVGLVAGLWLHWRGTVVLATGFLSLTWVYAARAEYFTEALRFAVPGQVFLAALAGVGAMALARLFGRLLESPIAGVLAAAAILFAALLYPAGWKLETIQEREHRFLRRSYAALPEGCTLVTSDFRLGHGNINAAFPFYEYRHRVSGPDDPDDHLVRASEFQLPAYADRCVLYYRGLACLSFDREDRPRDLRPECEAFEAGHQLEPIVTDPVPAADFPSYRFLLAPSGELAFFRIAGERRADSPAASTP